MDYSPWGPLPMEFSRQEYWSTVPFPTPGELPDPRIESGSSASPALAEVLFTASAAWDAHIDPSS